MLQQVAPQPEPELLHAIVELAENAVRDDWTEDRTVDCRFFKGASGYARNAWRALLRRRRRRRRKVYSRLTQ